MQTNSDIHESIQRNMMSREYLQQVHEVHVLLVSSDPNTVGSDRAQHEASKEYMRYLTCLL
jgi:hypothetical protein